MTCKQKNNLISSLPSAVDFVVTGHNSNENFATKETKTTTNQLQFLGMVSGMRPVGELLYVGIIYMYILIVYFRFFFGNFGTSIVETSLPDSHASQSSS